MSIPHVVVIGGGMTGLSCASNLVDVLGQLQVAVTITLIDAQPEVGGHATTVVDDGFVVEAGPNGFLDREPETLALVTSLGLGHALVEARPESKRRFIVRDGLLRQVPDSPRSLLGSDALSLLGKARLLWEPFARGPRPGVDETVYDFAARRIGPEAADMLVDAAVAGISAGDSRELSVRSQFPLMTEMEREHGGLIKAMIARRKRGIAAPRLLSFTGGLATLTGALAERLGPRIRRGNAVHRIRPEGARWRVALDSGEVLVADHVVLAVAARAAARLLGEDPALSQALSRIPYSGVQLVALAYRTSDIPRPLDGYGYLVTRGEQMSTLGVVWESSLFPGRAPAGMALLRAFVGGARRPEAVRLDDAGVVALVRGELRHVMHVGAAPIRTWVFRWPQAIAQYTVGHTERLAAIREAVACHEGLHVCGTSYDGVSLNHAIASGRATGRSVAALLAARAASTSTPMFAGMAGAR